MDRCGCKPSSGEGRAYNGAAGGGRRDYYRASQTLPPSQRPTCPGSPSRAHQSLGPYGSRHRPTRHERRPVTVLENTRTIEKVQSYDPADNFDDDRIEDPELCREMERLSRALDLMEFVAEISLRLEDRGSELRRAMDDELASYRQLVEDVFATWNKDVSDAAARNQQELKERYQQWTQRLKQRTKANNTWLRQYAPDFDWERYYDNPKYINQMFSPKVDDLMIEEEHVSQWRKQNFHKLHWLREKARKANAENDRLSQELDNSRRKNHDQQTLVNMNRELMHEKHAQLLYELKQLKEEHSRLSDTMGDLFMELENSNRSSVLYSSESSSSPSPGACPCRNTP